MLKRFLTNQFIISTRFVSQYYSKKKILVPSRLGVTPGNQHLEVNLFDDENKQSLGRMPLIEAHKLAKHRELLLVLFDESNDPPDVRLMTGKQLAQIRDETRANKKHELANEKITDFSLRLRPHIAEKDLLTKISQAKAAYSKGYSIRFQLDFGYAIDEKETEKLAERADEQKEFLERLKPYLEEFPKVHTNSKSTRSIILIVPSKLLAEKSSKKHEENPKKSMRILNRFSFRPIFYHYRTNTTNVQKKSNKFNIEYDPEKRSIIYPSELIINNQSYPTDSWTNVNPHILSRIGQNLYQQKNHPLYHLTNRLRQYFYQYYASGKLSPKFSIIDDFSPIVTTEQNFDSICTPIDHVSRTKSMNYYINQNTLLRAHTSAHQVDLMRSGLNAFLCIGDVYRRDSIDPTHYPVFHQCEGVQLFNKEELFIANRNVVGEKDNLKIFGPNEHRDATKQEGHTLEAVKLVEASLKQTITNLFQTLLSSTSTLNSRWVDATFPFTHPSWEYEIEIDGKWYELLGCGIIEHRVLENSGLNKDYIGWAFGLGLERIAMIMYGIPDIRLFWSNDSGFLSQFAFDDSTRSVKYKPISIYPQCINDLSMWMNKTIIDPLDFYDLVRSIGGDLIEQVMLIDQFYHKKKQKNSQTYRIIYRSMDRTLTKNEINMIHKDIENHCRKQFDVEIR